MRTGTPKGIKNCFHKDFCLVECLVLVIRERVRRIEKGC